MNCKRQQIVVLRMAMLSYVLLAGAPLGLPAQTATIHIRVLDGRTGKSVSGMNLSLVDYHRDSEGATHADLDGRVDVKTSADGDSYVANPDARGVLVFDNLGNVTGVWTPCTRQKLYDSNTRTYGNEYLYPVSTIVFLGLVAPNTCSRITATAKPGELVIFVRRHTWWEIFISVFET